MKAWKELYRIVNAFIKSLPQIVNLAILFLLINVIFALLGMQMFGGAFTEGRGFGDGELPWFSTLATPTMHSTLAVRSVPATHTACLQCLPS
jgi:hypothetical protein